MTAGPSLSEDEEKQIWKALAEDGISSLVSWARRPYTSDAKQQPQGDLSIAKQLQVAELLGELYALQEDIGDDTLAFKAKTGTSPPEDYTEFKGQLVTHGVRIGEAPMRCVPPACSVPLSESRPSSVSSLSSDLVLTEAFANMRG